MDASIRRTVTAVVAAWALVALALLGAPPGQATGSGPATTLSVRAPASATAGAAFAVTVTAKDAAGRVATTYRGRITLTSDDARMPTLVAGYTFTAADRGVRTFTASLRTAGSRLITAKDVAKPTITGRSAPVVVAPGAAARFAVAGPATTASGQAFGVQVTVKDPWFNIVRAYRGTVAFTSNDPSATLPGPYAFTAGDAGIHTFAGVVLRTAGPRTVTVTDTAKPSVTGALAVTVASTAGVYTWGVDGSVLGGGTRPSTSLPFRILTGPWADVEAGNQTTFAIRADHTLWGWGYNAFGQTGTGWASSTDASVLTPHQVGTQADWAVVAAGYQHTLGIRTNGSLWAWGDNEYGALGTGNLGPGPGPELVPTPIKIGTDRDWAAVSGGLFHSVGLKTDGTLWGWGDNENGALGDTTGVDRLAPWRMSTETWSDAAAGNEFSVGIRADGTLWLFAGNPTRIGTRSDWVDVDVEGSSGVLLRADGSIWSWTLPQVGNLPVQVGTGTGFTAASAGSGHGMALRADGSLWAWGSNAYGQLGDGTTTDRPLPVQVGLGIHWTDVAAGGAHTIGLGD
ncbi:MAG: hypothetical protein ABWY33_06240 [Cellulomonas sp.]